MKRPLETPFWTMTTVTAYTKLLRFVNTQRLLIRTNPWLTKRISCYLAGCFVMSDPLNHPSETRELEMVRKWQANDNNNSNLRSELCADNVALRCLPRWCRDDRASPPFFSNFIEQLGWESCSVGRNNGLKLTKLIDNNPMKILIDVIPTKLTVWWMLTPKAHSLMSPLLSSYT